MLMISIKRAKEDKDGVPIYFKKMGHFHYHKIILDILTKDLKCDVLSYDDLVTDIDSKLRWNGIEFDLNHHYMLGNFILSAPEHADALERLANQVADIINKKIEHAQKTESKGF